MWVPKNDRIRVSTGKKENRCEYRKIDLTSTGEGSNQCEYQEIVESGRVPGKGRIRASIEKLSRQLQKNGRITEK